MRTALFRLVTLLAAFSLMAACGPAASETTVPPEPPVQAAPTSTPAPPTDTPLPPTATPIPPPPEPQVINFTAEDGQALSGTYYPAAISPAPLFILIHWVASDEHDWDAIAPWLQRRQQASLGWRDVLVGQRQGLNMPWLDPSWFPPVPADLNVAVFTFSLRTCKTYPEGCARWAPSDWLKDTQAAFQTAAGLPGVDPSRIAAMGASIGADAAPDGCYLLNKSGGGTCLGAIALSPGSYFGMDFKQVVADMEKEFPATTIWCFAAKEDGESFPTCNS
ncbi:MAG: hypothetical protein HY784_17700, partial [Chloroflexi bacterium]|nr:hypothetical protein [Chloroflexota bacterium]